jgi:hypothetical protein
LIKIIEFVIKLFCGSMVLFYLIWAMFHDESSGPYPIKFEIAVMMIVVAILCNVVFFVSLGGLSTNYKKTTVSLLLMAAFFNFFMFISIAHNPFHLLEDSQWYVLLKNLCVWLGAIFFCRQCIRVEV